MATIFFVHGTGVRQQGFGETIQHIREGLANVGRTDLNVEGVAWGEMLGTHVDAQQISDMLPPTATKGPSFTDPELNARFWAELMNDPQFELRLAALRRTSGPVIAPPGALIPSEALKTKVRTLDLKGKEAAGGVPIDRIKEATNWLADGDGAAVLTEAAAAAGDANNPALVEATARAVVAYALTKSRGDIGAGPNALYLASERDALVDQVKDALSGGVKGVIDEWLTNAVKNFAKAQATAYARNRASGMMTAISPGVGDILLSQRRGRQILDLFTTEIGKIKDDVHVIGHSLGGIFLVDILSNPTRPSNVKKLITAGSQSPFFYSCDALETLRLRQPLTSMFTPWLNIYDRSDFLSFCAARTFAGVQDITDFEVSSGVPFPDSHGAYWRNESVYKKKISEFLS